MAEPGRSADETVVAQNVGETVGVPNSTPTDSVELAWSGNTERNDDRDTETALRSESAPVGQSWGATLGKAAILLAGGLGLAGALILGRWLFIKPPPPTKTVQPTASATAAPATASASSTDAPLIGSTPAQDNQYVQALNDQGISFANPQAAIYNGKMVCSDIGRGVTVQQEADAFRASNPALAAHANTYVAISVRTYCQQYSSLLPAGS